MQESVQAQRTSDEWITVRDFTDNGTGYSLPKYEVRYVPDVDKEYISDELVLVKKTDSTSGRERIYQFPKEVFEGVADRL